MLDGKHLGTYSWQWESYNYPSDSFSPRALIHETGHALGLPDLYDYDDAIGPKGGVGGLDQMDANWGDHNSFSKYVLDWLTPTLLTSGTTNVTLDPSSSTKNCVIAMPGIVKYPFQEYFVIQNRDRSGNDTYYPKSGLLIWHVDARLDSDGWDYVYNNSFTDHKLVRLMEADGLEEIEKDISANAGDYYVPGKFFTPASMPNSKRYIGTSTNLNVTNITASGSQRSADISFFEGCTYSISPTSATVGKSSGSGSVSVTASGGGCSWTATSNAAWITITSGSSGTGSGTVNYSYTANNTGAQRTGTITSAGQTFTLIQQTTGTIVVNPDPNAINAPWTLTGPNSYSQSGTGDQTLSSLPIGDYTLTWGDVNAGWSKPSPAFSTQTLASGGTITFTGTYTPTGIPQIQITPSSLYFGYVKPGEYKDLTLEVKNIGSGILTGTVSATPPFSIASGGNYSLSANQTQQVVVRYTAPLEKGAQTGSLIFTGGGGLTIQVKGTNQNVGLPWLMLLLGN
jgi:hypothetical protein